MKIKRALYFFLIIPLIVASCSDELQVQLDKPLDRPVIFCLLNPNDSIQYLRIQKIFLGQENALTTAKNHDSIYYPGATVMLEEIVDGKVVLEHLMTPTFDRIKDDGIFASAGHFVFEAKTPIQTGRSYRLQVDLPDHDQAIVATTTPFNYLEIIQVNRWPNGINMTNARYARVSWVTLPMTESYQLKIRFNYFDLTATDTIPRFIDWTIPRVTSRGTQGGEVLDISIPIEDWFLLLGDQIPVDDAVKKRVASVFDYTWYFAGEPLESYMMQDQTTRNGILSDYPQYSNIENAIGVFSYRSNFEQKGYSISLYTLERLTTHPATKYLKFDGRQYW